MSPALKLTCKRFVLLALSGALVLAGRAVAQRGEMGRATQLLPPDSRVVAERLAGLRELPAGTWKLHVGDVAHGEDVNLDDSAWQTIAVGEKAPNDAVWFRQTIQVPETLNGYDLTGARIWFRLQCERQRAHAGDFLFQWQARCAWRRSGAGGAV